MDSNTAVEVGEQILNPAASSSETAEKRTMDLFNVEESSKLKLF